MNVINSVEMSVSKNILLVLKLVKKDIFTESVNVFCMLYAASSFMFVYMLANVYICFIISFDLVSEIIFNNFSLSTFS